MLPGDAPVAAVAISDALWIKAAAAVSTPPTRTLMGVGTWLWPELLDLSAVLVGLIAWRQRCGPDCPICRR